MSIAPLNLDGTTIHLVPLSLDHVEALSAVGLDPQLWRTTTIQVRTKAEMAAYIRAALDARDAGVALPFAIVDAGTGTIIGSTRFHTFVPEHRRIEIGFTWIALPWQRTAANTESKYLLLRHAFETLGCIRVEFRADIANEQSRRALLRIGAREEGILRNYRVTEARGIRDLVVFSIIASEWPRVRTELEAKLRRLNAPGAQSTSR